jgi:UAA transporter family
VVLNVRKFTSLLLSVWVFGSPLSLEGGVGAGMVLTGALGYAWETRGREGREGGGKTIGGGVETRGKNVRQKDKSVGSGGNKIDVKGEFIIGEEDIKENGVLERRSVGRRRKL